MARISLPTSIGGVSIPGFAVNGPLGALFGNKFGRQDLVYPRDLQSATRGHYIQFTIEEIVKPAQYETTTENRTGIVDEFNVITNNVQDRVQTAARNSINSITSSISSLFSSASDVYNFNPGGFLSKISNLSKPVKRPVGTISLYIPETVNFTYNAEYTNTSLAEAAQTTPIKEVNRAAEFVLKPFTSAVGRLIARGQGYAFNPHQQILFNGINFRTYQMAFIFTPYSKQEAETVDKIIKLFKVHAAPRLATGVGMFFIPPSIFTPKFFFNGKENPKINRITESVIENIDVNYAPNGFSTMADGTPTQIMLTINFKEIELMTRDRIEQGY